MRIALLARRTLFTQPGGDTVQIQHTADALERLGHYTYIVKAGEKLPREIDVLHFFNIGRPADALPYFLEFEGRKVISTIFVDYSAADKFRFPLLHRIFGAHGMEYFKTIARGLNRTDRFPSLRFIVTGQRRSMQLLLTKTDSIITSSMSELERITRWAKMDGKKLRDRHHMIPLGLAPEFLHQGPSNNLRSGLLMVGRLEYLKNQLSIIKWAKTFSLPLTIIGDPNTNQPEYYQQCKDAAGPLTRFLPYSTTAVLIKEMDRHKVFVIPSLFETYSLVAWEAAARGMRVVANDVPDMNEVLEPIADLVDMNNEEQTVDLIMAALDDRNSSFNKKSQAWFSNYTWDQIGEKIDRTYR